MGARTSAGRFAPGPNVDLATRFWSKVDRRGLSDCWPWTGAQTTSRPGLVYGHMGGADGHTVRAHRVAYELTVGPIPAGLVIDRLCRNTLCVNPAHLEPVTSRENNIVRGRGLFADRARQTHCKRGHPLSGDNLRRARTRQCVTCSRDSRRVTL